MLTPSRKGHQMTQPYDPNQPPPPPPPPYGAPPPPPYGAPPPQYGVPPYGAGYGMPSGQGVNDPAPMGARLLARIIDGIIEFVVIIVIIAAVGIHLFNTTTTATGSSSFSLYGGRYFEALGIGALITALYEVGMIAVRGATLGKMAVGVRVARIDNGQVPGWGPAFVRWVIPAAAGALFSLLELIVFLSPFFDSTHRNRGWYDYAAKTIAVRAR